MSIPKGSNPQFDSKVLRELRDANAALPPLDLNPDPLLTYDQKKSAWPAYAPPSNITGLIATGADFITHASNYYRSQEELNAAFDGLQQLVETFPTLAQQAINSSNLLTENASGKLLSNMLKEVDSEKWKEATSDFPERDRPLTPVESDKLWKSIEPRMAVSQTISIAALMAVAGSSEEVRAAALVGTKNLVHGHLRAAHTALAFLASRAEENESDNPKAAEQDRQAAGLVKAEIDAAAAHKKIGEAAAGLTQIGSIEHVAPGSLHQLAPSSASAPVVGSHRSGKTRHVP